MKTILTRRIILPLLFCLPYSIKAQINCGFDQLKNQFAPAILNNYSRLSVDTTTVLKIPVVIHILHMKDPIGSINNPTEARIRKTLEYLSNTFRAQWAAYLDTAHGGVDIRIEFVLATKDSAGRAFNGIDRIDGSVFPTYARTGDLFTENLMMKTMWDRFRYFNIWLIHQSSTGRAGFGIFPQPQSDPNFYRNPEGIVLTAYAFNPGDPVIVHETGHYLGLDHTWASNFGISCFQETDCSQQGDKICDTENHFEKASCNMIGTLNPCTGLPYGLTLKNFMSYSELSCWDRFTRGQRNRMRETIVFMRPGIPGNSATILTPVALKELNDFMITPNPSFGNISIRFMVPLKNGYRIILHTSNGQVIYNNFIKDPSQSSISLNIPKPATGLYFITIEDGTARLSKPLFIR